MNKKIANTLHRSALIILTILSSLIFLFALVSGSEGFGGGIRGIIINSPNSIPWLILLGVVYLTWKKPVIGSSIILALSVIATFFFKFYEDIVVFAIIPLPLFVLASVIIFTNYKK